MPDGITSHAPDTLLVARAADFLAAGPADARALVERVCQLSGVPPVVAAHLAETLLGGHAGFARDGEGRWWLAAQLARQSAAAPSAAPIPRIAPIAGVERIGGLAPVSSGCPPGLAALPYVVVDVETTGTSADRGDRITEIAAIVVRDGQVTDRFETLVNPERPIPPWVTALTNISWSMVKDAPRFRDICDQVLAVLDGRIFVGHNAEFDWRFLCAEVMRSTGRRLDGSRLCTLRLARRLLPQLRSRRLDSVAQFYGIDLRDRHRAGGDAAATAHILLRLLADARGHACESWEDLQRLLDTPAGPRRGRRRPAMPRSLDRDAGA